MIKPPTLCFCVGATKASTSWLFRFLAQHPECHLRSIKELHFFDSLDGGRLRWHEARIEKDMAQRRAEFAEAPSRALAMKIADLEAWLSVVGSGDETAYVSYLTAGLAGQRLVADVTPAYALLTVDRLRSMASLMPEVRFVYLMRDPVARFWSHVRMLAARQAGDVQAGAARIFDLALAGQQEDVTDRGDYRAVLARLDAAIDPSRLLVMFQEVLLTVPGLHRLCGFLGLTERAVDFSRRVHAGADMPMTNDQLARARIALRPQYDFAATRFGSLPDAWLRNMGKGVA